MSHGAIVGIWFGGFSGCRRAIVAAGAGRRDSGVVHRHRDAESRSGLVAVFARQDCRNVVYRFSDSDLAVVAIRANHGGLGVVNDADIAPQRRLMAGTAPVRRPGMRQRLARRLRAVVTGKALPRGRLETPADVARRAIDDTMTSRQRKSRWRNGRMTRQPVRRLDKLRRPPAPKRRPRPKRQCADDAPKAPDNCSPRPTRSPKPQNARRFASRSACSGTDRTPVGVSRHWLTHADQTKLSPAPGHADGSRATRWSNFSFLLSVRFRSAQRYHIRAPPK